MDKKGAVKLQPGQATEGYIPAVEWSGPGTAKTSLIPWQQSQLRGKTPPVPKGESRPISVRGEMQHVDLSQNEKVHTSLADGLPAPVRRTANQRYEALVQRLLAMGRECTVNGVVCWPTSLQAILDLQGVKKDGDLFVQVRALAKHFIVKSENQQRAKDRKKSVLDWHGHYS